MTKKCSRCNIEKELSDFYPRNKGKAVIAECKSCTKIRRQKGYALRGHKHRIMAKKWQDNNKEWVRGRNLKNKYWPQLTWQEALAEYQKLFIMQEGLCAICAKPQLDQKNKMAVDHCHRSKIIRGLLCPLCNHRICAYIDRSAHSKVRPRKEVEMAELIYKYYKRAYGV